MERSRRYFTFMTSGCFIRTRGGEKENFNSTTVYMCSPIWQEGENGVFCPGASVILSVASKRSVAAPAAKRRPLNQNSIRTYTAGKDQHLRLFTMYSENIHPEHTPATFLCLPTHSGPGCTMTSRFPIFLSFFLLTPHRIKSKYQPRSRGILSAVHSQNSEPWTLKRALRRSRLTERSWGGGQNKRAQPVLHSHFLLAVCCQNSLHGTKKKKVLHSWKPE